MLWPGSWAVGRFMMWLILMLRCDGARRGASFIETWDIGALMPMKNETDNV